MNPNSALMQLVPFLLMILIFYFLLIRPQQKQMKERNEMLKSLKPGDKILTNAGLIGTIINIKEQEMEVEIAKGVKVNFVKNAVATVLKN